MNKIMSKFASKKTKEMEAIRINVNKQMDGYTFSIGPTLRNRIKSWSPNFRPARIIFVEYDVKSDFELYAGKLENYIYPILLGIDDKKDLENKVNEIHFINPLTGEVLHALKV